MTWPSRNVITRRAKRGDVRLVGDEHDRDALRAVELLEHLQDLDGGAAVEVAGRLVGEDQRRPVHQRARDGDALLLAARQLVRQVMLPVGEPDRLQRGAGAATLLRQRQVAVEQRQLDVLQGAGARDAG